MSRRTCAATCDRDWRAVWPLAVKQYRRPDCSFPTTPFRGIGAAVSKSILLFLHTTRRVAWCRVPRGKQSGLVGVVAARPACAPNSREVALGPAAWCRAYRSPHPKGQVPWRSRWSVSPIRERRVLLWIVSVVASSSIERLHQGVTYGLERDILDRRPLSIGGRA